MHRQTTFLFWVNVLVITMCLILCFSCIVVKVMLRHTFLKLDRYYKNLQKKIDMIGDLQFCGDQNWRHNLGGADCLATLK